MTETPIAGRAFDREVNGRLRRNTVFFHIPKSAGSTIVAYLESHYPVGRLLTGLDPNAVVSRMSAAGRQGWCVAAHIDMDHFRAIPVPYVSFCIFREPRQRLASRHASLREISQPLGWPLVELPRTAGFVEWMTVLADREAARRFDGPHGTPDQYYFGEMVRYLLGGRAFGDLCAGRLSEADAVALAIENTERFGFVLLTEDLDRGKAIIDAIIAPAGPRAMAAHNVTARQQRRAGEGYQLSPDELALADRLCRLELPVYEHVRRRYERYWA